MHDLKPISALGGVLPQTVTIGSITIAENDGLALASVAARLGQEDACKTHIHSLLGSVPGPGRCQLHDPEAGFWIGPDQWMIGAPTATHADLAAQLKTRFGETASITDQSGAWACFDITGSAMPDLSERICNIPIRQMTAGDAHRTLIHAIACYVIRRQAADHIRILGPRSYAGSLHHALTAAAQSVV